MIDLHAAPPTRFSSASDVPSGNCKYCFMISNKPCHVGSSKSSKWTLIPTLCRAINPQISRQRFIPSSFVGNPSLSKPATLMMSLGHLVCALGFLRWEVLHALFVQTLWVEDSALGQVVNLNRSVQFPTWLLPLILQK